jgi:chromosome condensin MukBEF ATPase and DNA-binding subunit MukB
MVETIDELRRENAELKRKNEKIEKENRWLRIDSSKRSFYALNRVINQQVDLLNDFEISDSIEGKKSENAKFERMQSLWKEMPKLVTELNDLRDRMKIDPDQDLQDEEVWLPISPEMIAD